VFAVAWFRRYAQWDRLWRLFPYVLVGMVPAYLVLLWLDERQFRPALGGLILALLALEWLRKWSGWAGKGDRSNLPERPEGGHHAEHGRAQIGPVPFSPDRWWLVGGTGFLAGFSSTVANAGGPVMTIYLLSRGLLKEQFIGTCAWFFFLLNLAKVVPFWTRNMLTAETIGFGLALSPVAIAGAFVGRWLVPRVSQRAFDLVVSVLAAGAAAWLIAG
jgi:uncharacterized membrane protein YfcA